VKIAFVLEEDRQTLTMYVDGQPKIRVGIEHVDGRASLSIAAMEQERPRLQLVRTPPDGGERPA
jgi:hypothetical protein